MKPIIKSWLDLDRYKLTMSQFIFFFYSGVKVKYGFTNRTKDENARKILVYLIPYINAQIALTKKLRLTFSELEHLHSQNTLIPGQGIFRTEYMNHLSNMEMCDVVASEKDGQLHIEYEGEWSFQTLWETIVLSIVAELYSRYVALMKYSENNKIPLKEFQAMIPLVLSGEDEEMLQKVVAPYEEEALKRIDAKIEIFRHHPTVKFFEFGTRRRFSASLQEKVLLKYAETFHKPQFIGTSQFLGTSNEYMGMKHGFKVGGTMAHEMFQVVTALAEPDEEKMRQASYEFLRQWHKFYGYDLSISLTDTFGSESFFKYLPQDIAEMYSYREDSATNLFHYTDMVIESYRKFKIHTNDKVIVHSNGLDPYRVVSINSYRNDEIAKAYGIGTDCSCDVGNGYKHLSIVIKAIEANDISTVKLSDNLAKAIGPIEKQNLYKKVFGYAVTESIEQVY